MSTVTASPSVSLQRMSRFQWIAIGLCIALNMLDGFDVMVMAFTAPHISQEWRLSGTQLGGLFSAGLFGMAAGSLFLAPWADRYGRRTIILWCLIVLTLGMGLSAFARDVGELALLRALTGVGIGGMLASVGVITAEYAADKWRSTAVALQATGYPVGATIGGLIASALLEHWNWQAVFATGALASLIAIPVVLRMLPESMDFLISRRPSNALPRLNDLLQRMRLPALTELPAAAVADPAQRSGYRALFAPHLLRTSLLIAAAFFLLMFSFYFVLSWTPKLLVSAGLSAQQGITGGVLLNLGGIVGGSLFGWFAARRSLSTLTIACMLLASLALFAFGAASQNLSLAFPIAFVLGATVFGSMAGLYALAPIVFETSTRTTGLGWAIGIGRIGAILSPIAVGWLTDLDWSTSHLYYLCAVPLLLAAAAVAWLHRSN
ncbi:MFS transporter [Lysobacter sp. CA199]|uniref:MFS transporter n=1 Tax=Lysobacter sp. CA199 TaxID=3455608 RepID=UPI003F8D00D2